MRNTERKSLKQSIGSEKKKTISTSTLSKMTPPNNSTQVRDLRARESRGVALAGSLLLRKHRSSLPEPEAWAVAEQAAAAAIDCGAPLSAAPAVAAARERFPDSRRADALAALFLEATGRLDDAAEICEAALEEAPAEAGLLSARRAALAWGRGDGAEALTLVAEHLRTYQSDGEAWAQAGDWYAAAPGMEPSAAAARAAFCYEEALLHAPTSAAAHARAADALFAAADAAGPSSVSAASKAASLEAARKHYGAAVALAGGGGCLRALWGLVACEAAAAGGASSSSSSAASPSKGGTGGRERQQQANGSRGGGGEAAAAAAENAAPLAAAALLKKYKEEAPDKVKLVEAALEGLGITAEKVSKS